MSEEIKNEEIAEEVQEVVEQVEEAPVAEEAVEEATTTSIPANRPSAAVVGAVTPKEVIAMGGEIRNICMECGWVHRVGKGIVSCEACGGKTREGLARNARAIVEQDQDRFTGKTATEVEKKDE